MTDGSADDATASGGPRWCWGGAGSPAEHGAGGGGCSDSLIRYKGVVLGFSNQLPINMGRQPWRLQPRWKKPSSIQCRSSDDKLITRRSVLQLSVCEEGLQIPPWRARHCPGAEPSLCLERRCRTALGLFSPTGSHSPFETVLVIQRLHSVSCIWGQNVVGTEGADGRPTDCSQSVPRACLEASICTTDCTWPTIDSVCVEQRLRIRRIYIYQATRSRWTTYQGEDGVNAFFWYFEPAALHGQPPTLEPTSALCESCLELLTIRCALEPLPANLVWCLLCRHVCWWVGCVFGVDGAHEIVP